MALKIEYDEARDIVTICGVKYSGEIFRSLGVADAGTWLRIEDRHDGVVALYTVADDIARSFDAIAGRGLASQPR